MPSRAAERRPSRSALRYPDRTSWGVVEIVRRAHDAGMTKRVLAAMLWFYTGWYAGAMIADIIGVSPVLGPLIGAAAAGLIAGDPRRIIWTARATAPASVSSSEALPEPA